MWLSRLVLTPSRHCPSACSWHLSRCFLKREVFAYPSRLHSGQVIPLGDPGCVTRQAIVRLVPCVGMSTPYNMLRVSSPYFLLPKLPS